MILKKTVSQNERKKREGEGEESVANCIRLD